MELTREEHAAAILQEKTVIVVYAGEAEEWWLSLAKSKRDAVRWHHTTNEAALHTLGVKAGTITMIRDFEDTHTVFMVDASHSNLDEIISFVYYHSSPIAVLLKKGDQDGLKIVLRPNVMCGSAKSHSSY